MLLPSQWGMMTVSLYRKHSYFSISQSYANISLVSIIYCQRKVFRKDSIHSLNICHFSQQPVGVVDTVFSYFHWRLSPVPFLDGLFVRLLLWILWKFHTFDLITFTLAPSRFNATFHTQFHIFFFLIIHQLYLLLPYTPGCVASAGACHLLGTTSLKKTDRSSFRSQPQVFS